ncbi:rod shape-determining protein MreC [Alteromonas sp. 1_MG-2023]|uniref:rod shape-determining protein MreC n=1 Tax=Alteromonas sp. 1_MG-2023 TaxID=3062669 RepID=UPI0026E33DEC|nr:rod shape-determining protein MreC [Alteromonas sp. 1_MG-2023]MDO6473948.1 rod shape-determining protein MreC [Alteromonas sp. 1_MG-2023]
MDTIFTRGPSLISRLILALVMSVALIIADSKFDAFQSSRVYMNSLMSPLQYLANLPSVLLSASAQRLTSHEDLVEENQRLTNQVLLMSERLQRFDVLQSENDQLRALLDTPAKPDVRKKVAELMAVENSPFSQQIVINKGALDDVFLSQSVLDDRGVVGQVMEVGTTNSRVVLITDVTHAVPVRSVRNNIRFIASGTGSLDELLLEHVPHSVDVEVGDILVTSGLGQVFPEGYPVAQVSRVTRDESRPFAIVAATPLARLDRLKYLLLLWPENHDGGPEFDGVNTAGDESPEVEND